MNYLAEDNPGARLWNEITDALAEIGPLELNVTMVCCGAAVPFQELTFDRPGAVAGFELSIRNPNSWESLTEAQLSEFEAILGCKLKQVWAYY